MFQRDKRIYYESRAAHATQLGDRAADPKIAAIHYELALRYRILAVAAEQTRPQVVALNKERQKDLPAPATALIGGSAKREVKRPLNHADRLPSPPQRVSVT